MRNFLDPSALENLGAQHKLRFDPSHPKAKVRCCGLLGIARAQCCA